MTSVRPLPLPDTATKAGYDHVDPMVQWFIGGNTAPAATATGINDDDRYGLDLQNSGVGGLSFRAFSGNGSHFARVNNSGVAFGGTFTHTGSASFTGSMTVGTGFTLTTGAASFGGSVTMASSLQVNGAVTGASLRITDAAVIGGGVTLASTLNVADAVVLASSLQVNGAVSMASTLTVTGVVLVGSGVTGSSFYASVGGGSAPYSSNSTTVCSNVNADMVDGLHATDFVTTGSYLGNGSTTRTITLGFQPKHVLITSNGGVSGMKATCHLLTTSTGVNIGFARQSGVTTITSLVVLDQTCLLSTGFQVEGGGGITAISNTSGDTFLYAAWRTS